MSKAFYMAVGGVALLLLVVGVILLNRQSSSTDAAISSFEECVAAGNPVMESYPRQCRAGNQTFTEQIGETEKNLVGHESINVDAPEPNEQISSPLEIEGNARGTWYFEATFPISIIDSEGNILGEWYAEAQDEWMTEDFVPYRATLEFETPATPTGQLILEKANPSGLPENADKLVVPVRFN